MFSQVPRSIVAIPFQPIDVYALSRRMKLVLRGREDGAKELPATNSTEYSSTELEILGEIEAHRSHAMDMLAAHLGAANDRLAQLETQMDVARMRQDTAKAISDFEAIRHETDTDVALLRGQATESRLEFERFKANNRLAGCGNSLHKSSAI